jgi:hypothetical protein
MDIMIVNDLSGSTEGFEPFINDAVNTFIDRFELSEGGIKIGLVAFSGAGHLISGLTTDKEQLRNANAIMRSIVQPNNTDMLDGINVAGKELVRNGRDYVRKMIILISDGDHDEYSEEDDDFFQILRLVSLYKVNHNVEFCGVLILANPNKPLVMSTISDDYCYVESSYKLLAQVLEDMSICM